MEGDDLLLWPGDDGSAPSVGRGSPASSKVLIIEDTPDHAELIWVMLAHARGPRWTSATVGTLSEARAWLRENHADVALLDLNLPDSRGPQTAGLICREYPELPIVIYTSLTDESVALAALQQGAQEHLVKGQFEGALLSRTLRLAVERKRAELAQARLAAIVENSTDAIIGATLYGIIVAWNAGATKVYGCSAAEALGRSLELLVRPESPEEMRSILPRLRRGEPVDSFETTIQRKDGRAVDILLTVSPVRDAGGGVNGISAIARDITDVKRSRDHLQAQLLQSQEMEAIGRRAGGVAHDLNNLLGIITGYTGLLRKDVKDARGQKRADEVLKAAERASVLARELLATSRKEVVPPKAEPL